MHTPQYNRRSGRVVLMSCAMLLFSCLFVLSSCGLTVAPGKKQNVAVPTGPLPTATPGPSQPVTLQDIHMLDEQNGWAVTKDKHILHTTSGATKWHEATPSTGGLVSTLGVYDFLDLQNAWAVMQAGDKFSVFHTYNGGGFWLETPLLDEGAGVSQISFADPLNGWLLFNKSVDTTGQAVDIFHTNDGGDTWLQISSVDNKTGDLKGTLPFAGHKSNISFHSASTGWVTGSAMDSKHPLVYMTTDSGFNWMPQTLTLPTGVTGTVTAFAPIFSSAEKGILPIMFSASENKVDLYSTQDGGKTWNSGVVTADSSAMFVFASDSQGWAIGSNGNADRVYTTSDAGHSWKQLVKPDATETKLIKLNFLSATQGWVLADMGDNVIGLFQSTDNGKSWTRLSTTAST